MLITIPVHKILMVAVVASVPVVADVELVGDGDLGSTLR